MDNYQTSGHPLAGAILAGVSIVSGIIASILANVEIYVRMGAGLVAIVSGFFAVRHYYYSTKKVLKELKSMK